MNKVSLLLCLVVILFVSYSSAQSQNNTLSIGNASAATQSAVVLPDSNLSLTAYTSIGGQAIFYDLMYPDGTLQSGNYNLNQGYNQLRFLAGDEGLHTIWYVIDNQQSNNVTIHVISTSSGTKGPRPEDEWINAGDEAFAEGRYKAALDYYTQASLINSASRKALCGIGKAEDKLGHKNEAQEAFAKVSEIGGTC